MAYTYYALVETPTFTKSVTRLLSEDDYLELQHFLAERPEVGVIIRGSGGLRKLRWKRRGQGKRGGVRVIYYLLRPAGVILLLALYAKNDRADLTAAQLGALREYVATLK